MCLNERYLRTRAPSEDSDQTAHSRSLIRIFTGRNLDSKGRNVSPCGHRRLKSDCADAQADLSLRWVHMSESMFSYVEAYKFCQQKEAGILIGNMFFVCGGEVQLVQTVPS